MCCLLLFFAFTISQHFGQRTLVLVDDIYSQDYYSSFFNILESKNLQLDVHYADDNKISLKKFGTFAYENLIIFGSAVEEFGGKIDLDQILSFLDSGRNILVVLDYYTQPLIRKLGYECGIEIDGKNSVIVDHFNSFQQLDDGKHSIFSVSKNNLLDTPSLKKIDGPLLYEGIGMVVDPKNDLALKILHAPSTSFPSTGESAVSKYPMAIGQSLSLISAIQTRETNGRALFVGSKNMFSDLFMNFNESFANRQLTENIVDWTFQQTGMIRIKYSNHSLAETGQTPLQYTIGDIMLYKLELEEFKDGHWIPFVANDVQLEIKRIDPFITVFMNTSGNGLFTAQVRLPDAYGVFKLIFEYNRPGYSSLELVSQITIRPLRHNQYERFIVQAYPYYAVVFSMMGALFLFSLFWLRAHAEYSTTLFDKVKQD